MGKVAHVNIIQTAKIIMFSMCGSKKSRFKMLLFLRPFSTNFNIPDSVSTSSSFQF